MLIDQNNIPIRVSNHKTCWSFAGFGISAPNSLMFFRILSTSSSDIREYIFGQEKLKAYDLMLLKYSECYWDKNVEYKLICFTETDVDLVIITRKRKTIN